MSAARGTSFERWTNSKSKSHRRLSKRLVPALVVVLCCVSNCVLVHPRAEQSVVCDECGLGNIQPRAGSSRPRYATCASPMAPRAGGRTRTPPRPRRWDVRLAARWLRMESPCGRTYARIFRQTGRLTQARRGSTRQCQRPRGLLCHSRTSGRLRTFQQASVERRTLDAVSGCRRSSLSGALTALHLASAPTSAG